MKRALSKSEVVEEIFNSVTHGLGAIAATVGLVLGVVLLTTSISYKIGFIVYCSSLVLLMLMSCLYHALKFTKAKKVFKVIDHGSIFLLIAGSFTPYIIVFYSGLPQIMLLIAVWMLAVAGIVLKATIFIPKRMNISGTLLYIVFGWLALFFIPKIHNLSATVIWLTVIGGLLYTLGTVFYASKRPFVHVGWHLFVVAAACSHFLAIVKLF